jgi:TPR repeat protein
MAVARTWWVLLAGLLLVFWAPASVASGPADVEALPALSKRCDAGKAEACFELGKLRHQSEDDAIRSWAEAAKAYQSACDRKHMQACNNLGDLYYRGRGVTRSPAIAVELYTRACDARNAEACFSLGYLISRGEGAERDDGRALTLFEKGCTGGYLDACAYQADALFVARDVEGAFGVLDAACAKGNERSCIALGNRLLWGNPLPKDPARGIAALDRGCSFRGAEACRELAATYARGQYVPGDAPLAAAYYGKACDLGDAMGCEAFGRALYRGAGVPADPARAAAVFERNCAKQSWRCESANAIRNAPLLTTACEAGQMVDCAGLAAIHEQLDGVLTDLGKAQQLYLKACDGGIAESCADAARTTEHGLRMQLNVTIQNVRTLYGKGCDGGYWEACQTLADMFAHDDGPDRDEAKAAILYAKACDNGLERACAQRDRFAGFAPDLSIASADAKYGPPPDEDAPPPAGGSCTTEEVVFEGRVIQQQKCVGYSLNGFDIRPGSAPWQALIERPPSLAGQRLGGTSRVLCGGSLIEKGWILTAAHCLYGDKKLYGPGKTLATAGYRVRLGVYDVTKPEGISYPILRVIPNAGFRDGDPTYANDIALIQYDVKAPKRLGTPYDMKTISLDQMAIGQRSIFGGMTVYAYGWGWTSLADAQASPILKGVKMALRTEVDCGVITRFAGPLANAVLCAGGPRGEQACTGDSGGPLIYYGDPGGVPRVIGVVSAGKKCGTLGEPSRYTRVAKSIAWIRSIVWPPSRRRNAR